MNVFPSEVLSTLENEFGGKAKRHQLASRLECSEGTISRKVAQLIKDGENIGFDKDGLFLQAPSDMEDRDASDRAAAWRNRIINSLKMWARRGNNHKPIAIAARKQFSKELTKEERKSLKANLLLIARVVDAVDLDEELGV